MAEHKITLQWIKGDVPFTYDAYPRNHQITFKDGVAKTFSAAPAYRGDGSQGRSGRHVRGGAVAPVTC